MKRVSLICLLLCIVPVILQSQTVPVAFVNQPLVPNAVPPGSSEFTLTVNGTGFSPTSQVNWNGKVLATTYISATKLTAIVPASYVTLPTTAAVTVLGQYGGASSNSVPFTVTEPATGLSFSSSTIASGLSPATILAADFNGDGVADLAVANPGQPDPECYTPSGFGSGTVSIFLGNGDGTFVSKSPLCLPTTLLTGDGAGLASPMVVGDFNNDGTPDLVLTWASNDTPENAGGEVFLGAGNGAFAPVGSCCSVWPNDFPVTADFNRDGNLDFISPFHGDFGEYNVEVTLGKGDGSFTGNSVVGNCVNPECLLTNAVIAGDFNGDGILDLVAVPGLSVKTDDGYTHEPITIFLGNGDGSFTPATQQPSITFVNPISITTGDFDGDGVLDLVIADSGATALIVLHGNGDGTFTQVNGQPSLSQPPSFVTAADMNGDGKLDLVVVADTISILLGNGDGTFQTGFVGFPGTGPVAVGDFNGDGRLDLAVGNGSTVSMLLQQPFRPGVAITLASPGDETINVPVPFTVEVWASPTLPTGSVTLKQGGKTLGTGTLSNGQATITTTFPNPGVFPIVAVYSGDQNYKAKTSQTIKQTVTKYNTTASLQTDPKPSTYGQAVTLTCAVISSSGNPPNGTVTFENGPLVIGTAPLVNGSATVTKSNLPTGTILITAVYNGNASNSQSTSNTVTQVVQLASTTTTVTSTPNPSHHDQTVALKAAVTSSGGVPTGSVTFTAGATTLGTVNLAAGKATLHTSALPVGSNTITATYNGSTNFDGSSGSSMQTVN